MKQPAPIRVFHVTGCLEIGGQEKLLVEFAGHADRRRFALHFVSLEKRGALACDIEAEGWPVTALDVPPGLWPSLVLRLARLFRRGQADVVHTHNERPLIYAAPAARLARASCVVHTRHGRGVRNTRRQDFLARLAARAVDHYVCVSEDSAELTVTQGIPRRRVEVLHNGIDTRRFEFRGPSVGGPAVVVARLAAEKDVATLLHATALVIRQWPSFRLAIAGDGPCMPELRQLTSELGIGAHVQFLGMMRDVPALLANAGLFVLSSVSEGVPLTLLEAMACGLPVVATRVGGIPEVVVDAETGTLVQPGDPVALAAAIVRLVADDERSRQMGAAGRRRVERLFEIRQMVAAYERMYASKITEDRHDAVDDGPDRGLRRSGVLGDAALAAAARD